EIGITVIPGRREATTRRMRREGITARQGWRDSAVPGMEYVTSSNGLLERSQSVDRSYALRSELVGVVARPRFVRAMPQPAPAGAGATRRDRHHLAPRTEH